MKVNSLLKHRGNHMHEFASTKPLPLADRIATICSVTVAHKGVHIILITNKKKKERSSMLGLCKCDPQAWGDRNPRSASWVPSEAAGGGTAPACPPPFCSLSARPLLREPSLCAKSWYLRVLLTRRSYVWKGQRSTCEHPEQKEQGPGRT